MHLFPNSRGICFFIVRTRPRLEPQLSGATLAIDKASLGLEEGVWIELTCTSCCLFFGKSYILGLKSDFFTESRTLEN